MWSQDLGGGVTGLGGFFVRGARDSWVASGCCEFNHRLALVLRSRQQRQGLWGDSRCLGVESGA